MLHTETARIRQKLYKANIPYTEKDINYGHQFVCIKNGETVHINVYQGKKGISYVVQGKTSPLKRTLTELTKPKTGEKETHTAAKNKSNTIRPENVTTWIGCDESGKGDVFGPLVAAACLIHVNEEEKLRDIGVCDSKLLTDNEIARIASDIHHIIGKRAVVTTLFPAIYNKKYAEYKAKGQKLNHLLGDLHSQNILDLLSKYACSCAIVDKFGNDKYVQHGLKETTLQVIQVPRGERDIAVATASILARQAFVEAMNDLSEAYGIYLPKGAYAGVPKAIQEYRSKYGDSIFWNIGKLHFKTFNFLRED